MPPANFDEVLSLEEGFYNHGLEEGKADGVKAGRIEGRTFGLEKGFEKYVESGRLFGKALVWANRLPQNTPKPSDSTSSSATQSLPPLVDHQRLFKHVKVLHALSESGSLSTENTEDAVSDFDDRLKRSQGKVKIIERITGEGKRD